MRYLLALLMLSACAPDIAHEPESRIELALCPPDNCSYILGEVLSGAESVSCAFYDLDDPHIIKTMRMIPDLSLVLDEDSPVTELDALSVREHGRGLMHNKFCIVDDALLVTGTYNPTISGQRNSNLILVSDSQNLISSFSDEFEELSEGTFHGGSRGSGDVVQLNDSYVSVLFCPEDGCEDTVVALIDAAQSEILFMSFSITSMPVVGALTRAHKRGIHVEGLAEPFQAGNRVAIPALKDAGITVHSADVDALFHHKAFIVDRRIIATGSYNPTKSANTVNDEALLLIESDRLAAQLVQYFNKIKK